MREFAIINVNGINISESILKKLPKDANITVFAYNGDEYDCENDVKIEIIPEEIRNSQSKVKNFVSKHYFDRNFKGFLHVIEDRIEILKDTTQFLEKIEEMMVKLKLKSWFNTETDVCNYTFKQFNPRISITIDEPKAKSVYDKTVFWTSHSNTSWICYDLNTASFEDVKFNESFTIPMFFIIHFLSERRNNKKSGELYYMNYYPTIEEERFVFRLREDWKEKKKTNEELEQEQKSMSEENETFQKMNINHTPDSSVEMVIEDMFNTLTK